MLVIRVQCTYCGADTEDNFTPCGIAIAIFCFPIGLFIRHLIFRCHQFSIMQYRHRHILIYNRFIKTYHLWLKLLLSNVIKSNIYQNLSYPNQSLIHSSYVKFAFNVYSATQCKELQSNIWSAQLVAWPLSIFGFPVASLCKILNQHLKFTFHPVFVWYFCGSEDKGTIWFPSEGKLNSLWPHNLQSLCSSKEHNFFTLCNMFFLLQFFAVFLDLKWYEPKTQQLIQLCDKSKLMQQVHFCHFLFSWFYNVPSNIFVFIFYWWRRKFVHSLYQKYNSFTFPLYYFFYISSILCGWLGEFVFTSLSTR